MLPRLFRVAVLAACLATTPLVAQVDLAVRNVPTSRYDGNLAGTVVSADFLVSASGGTATNAVATFEYPAFFQIAVYEPDQPCASVAGRTRCVLGDLSGSALRLMVDVYTAPVAQHAELKVTITPDTVDPDLTNNVAIASWDLVLVADLNARITPPVTRVDPGALVTLRADLDNFASALPADVRADFKARDASIVSITPPEPWTCIITEGAASCVAPSLDTSCQCARDFRVTLRASENRSGGTATLSMHASSVTPDHFADNDSATASIEIYRWIVVTTTADAGDGSLRAAIDDANASCALAPCKIAFEIAGEPTAGGFFTIAPANALPPVTAARVVVDGATQTAFSGDTNAAGPEIAIDGRFTREANGLEIRSVCEGVVNDLAIGKFDGYGIVASLNPSACPDATVRTNFETVSRPDRRLITRNHLGTDPAGREAWPNLRGIAADDSFSTTIADNLISGNRRSGVWIWRGAIDVTGNRIGTAADGTTPLPNGASGIFAGPQVSRLSATRNVIAYHPDMGVAIAAGAGDVYVEDNSIFGNAGLAIDRGLDSVTPAVELPDDVPNAPTILSAVHDHLLNKTVVTVSLRSSLVQGQQELVTVYAGERPGDLSRSVGLEVISPFDAGPRNTNGIPFTIELAGDARGHWLTATSTRHSFLDVAPALRPKDGTSEPGNSIFVGR